MTIMKEKITKNSRKLYKYAKISLKPSIWTTEISFFMVQ